MRRERFAEYWKEYDARLERTLCWQGQDYTALLPRPLCWRVRDVCPAFVFALAADWGLRRPGTVELALALEYSYLSFFEHRLPWEAEMTEQRRQYGILFGDFFAAQALTMLSGELLFPYYAFFAELIRTMNEGVLLLRRLRRETMRAEDWRAVLQREKAALVLPVRVLAVWAPPEPQEAQFLERLATELSVLWGAGERGQSALGRASLTQVEGLLAEAPLGLENLRVFVSDLAARTRCEVHSSQSSQFTVHSSQLGEGDLGIRD
ncbi:MAG: hypothetical protein LBS10_05180 [Gracilibacteraceae bacterium]|jgi:hypothetical protein|nr:hypothetical protein [Gracilibacteraceae bacterium]